MCYLAAAAAFLLLALSPSALAEPVRFKDCGESRTRRRCRALAGGSLLRQNRARWGGSPSAAGLSLGPLWGWVGSGRGETAVLEETRPLAALSLSSERVRGVPGRPWPWVDLLLEFPQSL